MLFDIFGNHSDFSPSFLSPQKFPRAAPSENAPRLPNCFACK
jgi:hypothetical protein